MKNIKKAAIISAMVLMISIIPAFALNDTNTTNETQTVNQTSNTTQTQDQNQTQSQNTSGTTNPNCHKNCNSQNCGTCDGEQHKYQYGQKNGNACANNGTCDGDQHKYQYGQKGNAGANCNNPNCPKS